MDIARLLEKDISHCRPVCGKDKRMTIIKENSGGSIKRMMMQIRLSYTSELIKNEENDDRNKGIRVSRVQMILKGGR